MTGTPRPVSLDDARHRIASAVLGARGLSEREVGDVVLWPHQRDAVSRLRAAIAEFGGALLADDVGTGKTYIALAVAARYAAPLVVAPASLRDSWRVAAERVGRTMRFVSFESLSRGRRPAGEHDFVIVDEAHHARNPVAKRYTALASLVAAVPVLLLTATPIHNRREDVVALLALFRGTSAAALDDAALARCLVRRSRDVLSGAASLPAVRGPIAIASDSTDDATPAAILALPPPVPAADAGTAGALLAITLLRQWASSQGALLAAVRRRLAAAHALAATLDTGRYPTRAELAAWTLGDDAQQLVMSELLAPDDGPSPVADLSAAVAAHVDGLRAIRRAATADPDVDRRRARRLRELWRSHPGARSIAFTQFAETVDAYWRELRDQPRVCALTARGGRVAGGAVSRREALGSFAPGQRWRAAASNRIDSLLVTDLASEGLDLQEASVLVHLDLPWTPARLEQRVGRIVRPGSPHALVHVYTMDPPVRAATLLDIRQRLAAKLAAARGVLGDVMPELGLDPDVAARPSAAGPSSGAASSCLTLSAPAAAERIEQILSRWRAMPRAEPLERATPVTDDECGAPIGAIINAPPGAPPAWLALVGGDPPRLVAAVGDEVGDDPALVAQVCALIDAAAHPYTPHPWLEEPVSPAAAAPRDALASANALASATAHLTRWLDAQRGAALAGIAEIPMVRTRRHALSAIARFSTAPASTRLTVAATTARALHAASRPLPASLERDLRDLAAHPPSPDSSLVSALSALTPAVPPTAVPPPSSSFLALIALLPAG